MSGARRMTRAAAVLIVLLMAILTTSGTGSAATYSGDGLTNPPGPAEMDYNANYGPLVDGYNFWRSGEPINVVAQEIYGVADDVYGPVVTERVLGDGSLFLEASKVTTDWDAGAGVAYYPGITVGQLDRVVIHADFDVEGASGIFNLWLDTDKDGDYFDFDAGRMTSLGGDAVAQYEPKPVADDKVFIIDSKGDGRFCLVPAGGHYTLAQIKSGASPIPVNTPVGFWIGVYDMNNDSSSPAVTLKKVIVNQPSEVWVNNLWQGNLGDIVEGGHIFGIDAFASIQEAVDAVEPGGTVHVAEGAYEVTQILIRKGVTLKGAGAGKSIIDGGAAVTLPSAGTLRIENTALPVVVDGFTFRNAGDKDGVICAICARGFTAPVTIQNNHFIGRGNGDLWDMGVWTYSSRPGGGVIIKDNEFERMWQGILLELPRAGGSILGNRFHHLLPAQGGSYEPEGVFAFTYGGAANDVGSLLAVNGNLFTDFSGVPIALGGGYPGQLTSRFTNVEIKDNTIEAIGVGATRSHTGILFRNYGEDAASALLGGVHNAVVSGNTITGSGGSNTFGIWLHGLHTNISIEDNSIQSVNEGIGVEERTAGAGFATGVRVNRNRITGTTKAVSNGSTSRVDATRNYWGVPDYQSISALVDGNVCFDPWYVDPEMSTLASAMPVKNATKSEWYETIQAAIDDAGPGDVIELAAKTFDECFKVVGKGVTIKGAGMEETVIKPSSGLLATGVGHKYDPDMRVVVFVDDAADVHIQDMTVDGNNLGGNAVIFWNSSSGSLEGVKVSNPRPLDGVQTGQGIAVDAGSGKTTTLDINECEIRDFNKNGIDVVNGNGATSGGGSIVVNVNGGAIIGRGKIDLIAQNGILFWERAGSSVGGSVDGVAISSIEYTPDTDEACGVLLYGVKNGIVTVENVSFTGVEQYIGLAADTDQNLLVNTCMFDGIEPASAADAELAGIEDKIIHKMDDAGVGVVYIKPKTLVVTKNNRGIQAGVDAAVSGDTVLVTAGPYDVSGPITVSTANVTLKGEGPDKTVLQTTGSSGYLVSMTGEGSSLEAMEIVKQDKANQNLIYVGANDVKIIGNRIYGKWVQGDSDVTRAMEIASGLSGLEIKDNLIYGLRQPAYINPKTTGNIVNNTVFGTRGWVVDGANVTFTDNKWGTGDSPNYVDIAILPGTDPSYYPDILAVSADNYGAVVEDQRVAPAVLSVTWVDANAPAGGNGTAVAPYQTIAQGIQRVVAGGVVNVKAGTYTENLAITKPVTLKGPNFGIDPNKGPRVGEAVIGVQSGIAVSPQSAGVVIDGFTITAPDTGFPVYTGGTNDVDGLQIRNNIIGTGVRAVTVEKNGVNVSILNNKLDGARYGLMCNGRFSNLDISGNVITDRATTNGVFIDGLSTVDGFRFTDNAVNAKSNIAANITNGVVSGNSFSVENGSCCLEISLHSSSEVSGNTFSGDEDTGGLRLWGTQYNLVPSNDTTIQGNTFNNCSYGIALSPGNRNITIGGNTFNAVTDRIRTAAQISGEEGVYYGLSEALDEAPSGATVKVEPGVYNQSLTLTKPVTLRSTGGAAVTILDGNSATENYYMVNIKADNVTVDGFTITNPLYAGTADASGVVIGSEVRNSNIRITNCVIHDIGASGRSSVSFGTFGINVGPVDGLEIDHCHIYNIKNGDDSQRAIGIFTWGNDPTHTTANVHVHDNLIEEVSNPGPSVYGISTGYFGSNITVSNNRVTGIKTGIRVGDDMVGPVTVSGNTVENAEVCGVRLDGNQTQTVTGNTITGCATGILLKESCVAAAAEIDRNTISGNTLGMENLSTAVVDATGNNWGADSGPKHASNPGGEGDEVQGNVRFSPWLTAGGEEAAIPIEVSAVYDRQNDRVDVTVKESAGLTLVAVKVNDSEVDPLPTVTDGRFSVDPFDGLNNIRVEMCDALGNIYRGTCTLAIDMTAPATVLKASRDPDGLDGWYKGTAPTVTLTTEAGAKIRYRWNQGDWAESSGNEVLASAVPEGVNTLYYYAVDAEGNQEPEKSHTFEVDTVAPTGSIVINSGRSSTTSREVTLTLSCTGEVSTEEFSMRLSNDAGMAGAEWQSFAETVSWTLLDGYGEKAVYVQFRDQAGNESVVYSDSITLARSGGGGGGGGAVTPPPVQPPVVAGSTTEDIEADSGGTVALPDNSAAVTLPPAAVEEDVKVTVAPVTEITKPTQGMVKIGNRVYEITVETKDGKKVTSFSKAVTLTFQYADEELGGTSPEDLRIFYWDEAAGAWVAIPSTVDPVTKTVVGTTDHLTVFALMAKPGMPAMPDIKGHWAEAPVLRLVSLGVVGGYEDGTFRPEVTITREQFAKMIVLASGIQPEAAPALAFADNDSISGWARGYVAAAVKAGIIKGLEGNRFGPAEPVTRAQVATMLIRALNVGAGATSTTFADNAEIPSWAVGSVQAAVEKGIVGGFADGTFKPGLSATRAQAAKMLSQFMTVRLSQ